MARQSLFTPSEMLTLWRQYGHAPASQRERAAFCCQVLREVEKYCREGMPVMQARDLVAGNMRQRGKRGVSASTIANWQHMVAGSVRADWPALLLPRYTGRVQFAPIAPDMWMRFKTDFLRHECPSAASCYDRLKSYAEARGRPIPSLKTLIRRMDDELPMWRQRRRNGPQLHQFDLF